MNILPPWLVSSLRQALDPTGGPVPLLSFNLAAGLILALLVIAAILLLIVRRTEQFLRIPVLVFFSIVTLAFCSVAAYLGRGLGNSIFFWIPMLAVSAVLLAGNAFLSLRAYLSIPAIGKIGVGLMVIAALSAQHFSLVMGSIAEKLLLTMSGTGLLVFSLWHMTDGKGERGFWLFLGAAAGLTPLLDRVSLEASALALPPSGYQSLLAAMLFSLKWAVPAGLVLGAAAAAAYSLELDETELPRLVGAGRLFGIGLILAAVLFAGLGLGNDWLGGRGWQGVQESLTGFFGGMLTDFPGWLDRTMTGASNSVTSSVKNFGNAVSSGFRNILGAGPFK